MANSPVRRVARSIDALSRILDQIETGEKPKPDWIEMRGDCRLENLQPGAQEKLLARLHPTVLRGFRLSKGKVKGRRKRLGFWRRIAAAGFHDFSEAGFTKCYDSPFLENYDYVGAYLTGGLAALNEFAVYSAVLGTHDYSVEDFVETDLCRDVKTIVEPMAGSAEFAYHGHFRYPDFRYLMFDLDESAKQHVGERRWLPGADQQYLIGDVLDEGIWKQLKSQTTGKSLSYIGKQSHHFLNAKQLLHLLELGTRYIDYFMLEVPEPSLVSDLDETEDLTRPEMEDAGFQAGLVDEEGVHVNPLTNHMSFSLQIWDEDERRVLFRYSDWTSWQAPMLVALASLLDLQVYYYHSDDDGFRPVAAAARHPEATENVSFLVFTRPS